MASGLRNLIVRSVALATLIAALPLFGPNAWAAPEKTAGGIRFTYHDANASSVVSSGPRNPRTSGSAFMAAHGEKSDSRHHLKAAWSAFNPTW